MLILGCFARFGYNVVKIPDSARGVPSRFHLSEVFA